ncbi:MAG: hypothetical protein ACI4FY_05765 [Acetatifactor sp.]
MKKILDIAKSILLYAGMYPEEYEQIVPDMQRENRKSLMAFSLIAFCRHLLLCQYSVSLRNHFGHCDETG